MAPNHTTAQKQCLSLSWEPKLLPDTLCINHTIHVCSFFTDSAYNIFDRNLIKSDSQIVTSTTIFWDRRYNLIFRSVLLYIYLSNLI